MFTAIKTTWANLKNKIRTTWANLKNKIRKWIDTKLQDTHNHYLSFLPEKIGLLAFSILRLFYSGIRTDPQQLSQIKNLQKEGLIVYVIKYRSSFDYLFAYTHFKQHRIPFPQLALGYKLLIWQPLARLFQFFLAHLDFYIQNRSRLNPFENNYYKQELLQGRTALLHLIEKGGFYRRFVKEETDPVQHLIAIQKTMPKPIFLVPQLTFFDKNPHRNAPAVIDLFFGTKENPNKIRRFLTLLRNPGKVFVELSEPFNLQHFLQESENKDKTIASLTIELRHRLLFQLNRHRQSITGPILKSSVELKENILATDHFQAFMKTYAQKHKQPIQQIQKKADEHLDEIAARYRMAFVKFAALAVKWILKTMFEGISVNEDMFAKIKTMAQKGPLIFVPCHKSHIDYLLISYMLYTHNMPAPHIAAGKNLSFWPMGPLFRRMGAFFLRRSFGGAALYSKVFSAYIQKLLEEGYNIEFFIEGGRSRTGKLIFPKLGFLSILLEAYKNNACEDMIFVPIYVGYDRVLEESSYLQEIKGGKKEPERFIDLNRARKFLKKRYGRIYLNFHEPISLNRLLSQLESPLEELPQKDQHAFCRNIGHRIINAITGIAVVTPHGLVASALLNHPKSRFSLNDIMTSMETYLRYLSSQNVQLADTLRLDHFSAIEQAFDAYLQRKIIEQIPKTKADPQTDDLFKVNVARRPILEYYKNNCIAYFIPPAFTSLAILERDSFQFSASELRENYIFFQNFFKNEFAYNVDLPPEYSIRKSLKAFIDDAVIIPHQTLPDTYTLTPAGLKKLKYFSRFLKTYFESYWVILAFLGRSTQNSIRGKAQLKKIQALGTRMYKRREINQNEALSKINFQNAIDYFSALGIKGADNKDQIDYYSTRVKKYLNHLST